MLIIIVEQNVVGIVAIVLAVTLSPPNAWCVQYVKLWHHWWNCKYIPPPEKDKTMSTVNMHEKIWCSWAVWLSWHAIGQSVTDVPRQKHRHAYHSTLRYSRGQSNEVSLDEVRWCEMNCMNTPNSLTWQCVCFSWSCLYYVPCHCSVSCESHTMSEASRSEVWSAAFEHFTALTWT